MRSSSTSNIRKLGSGEKFEEGAKQLRAMRRWIAGGSQWPEVLVTILRLGVD